MRKIVHNKSAEIKLVLFIQCDFDSPDLQCVQLEVKLVPSSNLHKVLHWCKTYFECSSKIKHTFVSLNLFPIFKEKDLKKKKKTTDS